MLALTMFAQKVSPSEHNKSLRKEPRCEPGSAKLELTI